MTWEKITNRRVICPWRWTRACSCVESSLSLRPECLSANICQRWASVDVVPLPRRSIHPIGYMPRNRRNDVDKRVGSLIRARRAKLGMSQRALGSALGVTFQQIQKYEKAENTMAASRIVSLCQILQLTPNELFGLSARSVSGRKR
jgi:DNA-binding XRE family transcriptional regulator